MLAQLKINLSALESHTQQIKKTPFLGHVCADAPPYVRGQAIRQSFPASAKLELRKDGPSLEKCEM